MPDSVLLKPGPLDDDDQRIMRKHPIYAYEMLSPEPNFQQILDIPFTTTSAGMAAVIRAG